MSKCDFGLASARPEGGVVVDTVTFDATSEYDGDFIYIDKDITPGKEGNATVVRKLKSGMFLCIFWRDNDHEKIALSKKNVIKCREKYKGL